MKTKNLVATLLLVGFGLMLPTSCRKSSLKDEGFAKDGFMMLLPNLALAIPMSVDSFLASKANLDKSYEWILTMEASASTTAGDTIIKKYVSQAEDSGSADSVFLYFSKQIDFSLVTVIPREEPQLFRMEILLSEPKRKWLFEAEKATVNIKELKEYFSLLQ